MQKMLLSFPHTNCYFVPAFRCSKFKSNQRLHGKNGYLLTKKLFLLEKQIYAKIPREKQISTLSFRCTSFAWSCLVFSGVAKAFFFLARCRFCSRRRAREHGAAQGIRCTFHAALIKAKVN